MYDLGGTYRAHPPHDTLAKLEPLLWKTFGITRVANITGLDNINIPTYVAIRPLSKLVTTAQGKGVSDDLAKISAIMESIEGWHAERIPKATLFGTYDELKKTHNLIDFDRLQLNDNYHLPKPTPHHVNFAWIKGIELNSGREIYFPKSLIDLNTEISHRHANYNYNYFFSCSSNGLASGNTYEEAVCHGLYEVIERDNCALSEASPPQDKRNIEISTVTTPHLREIIDKLKHSEVELEIIDATNHIQVPAYIAKISDLTGLHALGSFSGAGAHLSSVVALSRAITEAIQARLTFISGTRDDCYPSVYQALRNSWYHLNRPRQASPASFNKKQFPFVETRIPNDFTSCIQQLLQQLNRTGYTQVIVYDHTQQNIGIPVVHVLVPGLRYDSQAHTNHAYFPDCL